MVFPTRDWLVGGDRRSIGRVAGVIELIHQQPERLGELVGLLWDVDAIVRMRAADGLEKLSLLPSVDLQPFKAELLGLMAETGQQEVRWHLALIVPRLRLSAKERGRVVGILKTYLDDRSAIVKTHAMQGLWNLSASDGEFKAEVVELVRELTRTGTPALRARGRKLLREAGNLA